MVVFDETLQIQPFSWEVEDKAADNGNLQIRMWGMDQDSNSLLFRVENFPVFYFVELPMFHKGDIYDWNVGTARLVVDAITKNIDDDYAPLEFRPTHFGMHKKLYHDRGELRYPMIMLLFPNQESARKVARLLDDNIEVDYVGSIKCVIHEDWIDPVRKMLTKCDITHTSWIECQAAPVYSEQEKISTLRREYIASWPTMKRIDPNITKNWSTHPGRISLDIEVYSHRHNMFPDKWNPLHCAYMISCIYRRVGSKANVRYGIIMGDCNHIPPERLENVMILRVETEEELVRMMAAVIQYHDPEILTGYNVLGFDYGYLDARLDIKKWPVIGRLKGIKSFVKTDNWSSGAYGHNSNSMLYTPGRITIDMLVVVKREFKLNFYDLNTVANMFVHKSKHDIKAARMFQIYENMKNAKPGTPEYAKAIDEMTDVMLYCIQDSELVLDIMDEIHLWISAVEMSSIVGVTISDLFTRGQQIRCISQLYNLATKKGHVVDTRTCPDIPFEGGFVNKPTPGLHDNVIFMDFKSLYPSIIRAYNICYTTLIPPERMYIKDPRTGKNVVNEALKAMCNCISINCTDEVEEEEIDEDEKDEQYRAMGAKGVYEFWFLKHEHKQGLLPKLVGDLVDARNAVKDLLKDEKDPLQKIILDKRQNALKICANSFFGFLGIREGGKLPLLEGAMSITGWGRQLIKIANDFVVTKYNGKIIYGDTDSSAIVLPDHVKDSSQCYEWGHRLKREITALYPPPLEMDYEKSVTMLSLKKKKYAGIYYTKEGPFKYEKNGDLSLLIRGVLIARRDNCKWARDIYKKILIMVLTRVDLRVVTQTLAEEIDRLLTGKVPIEDLIIVRTLGASYKKDNYYMKVFSDCLRDIGKPVQAGERLGYLVVERPLGPDRKKINLGKRLVLYDAYMEGRETGSTDVLDYTYYVEKVLQNHVDQLIAIGYNTIIPDLALVWRPANKGNFSTLNNVTELIMRMRVNGIHYDELQKEIDKRMNNQAMKIEYPNMNIEADDYLLTTMGPIPIIA